MQTSEIEKRAKELDEARKVRLLRPNEVDFDKYLKANDVAQKVRPAKDWLGELRAEIGSTQKVEQAVMPWTKTQSSFQFRPGEVTLYAGSNGGGKSLITGQIALGLIKQEQKICVASFEMKPKRTLYRMLRQFAGENIENPMYAVDKEKYLGNLFARFQDFAGHNMWLYDQQGTVTAQQVIAVSRYCAVELGVKHMFIDSLMKCVPAEDDYNAQKYFVDELTALARDHSVHVHLIHHIRKLPNDEQQPSKNDVKGSGAITDQVDNVLIMWRNKKKEHKVQSGVAVEMNDPDAMLMCEKQRNGEAEDWFNLWYHRESQQFVEAPDALSMSFDNAGRF
jgi:twinkle protein